MTDNGSQSVAVIGGGRMGVGIAQVFLMAGHRVMIAERDSTAATAAVAAVVRGLARAAERRSLAADPDELTESLGAVHSMADLPGEHDLVIEAVPELPDLKREVLRDAEGLVGFGGVLATNTSSLSITGLAGVLARPERLVGLHFFNPVPVSTLVEIVVGAGTADDTVGRAVAWVGQLGKKHIVVRDSPGFASSRLGVLLGLEAMRMVEEGVADAASIDTAMELGYRHPMGPLRSSDLVGLDVRLAIAEELSLTLGDRFAPPALLRDKVARGELGRKSGKGFHDWN